MTRFGPRIEHITSPTPGGCATYYATDAVAVLIFITIQLTILNEYLKSLQPQLISYLILLLNFIKGLEMTTVTIKK